MSSYRPFSGWTSARYAAFYRMAMTVLDARGVLGFPVDYQPSKGEVVKAYKLKAFQNHPDRGGDLEEMVKVNVAKDILLGISPASPPRREPPKRDTLNEDRRAIQKARDAVLDLWALDPIRNVWPAYVVHPAEFAETYADRLDELFDVVKDEMRSTKDQKTFAPFLKNIKELLGALEQFRRQLKKFERMQKELSPVLRMKDLYDVAEDLGELIDEIVTDSKALVTILNTTESGISTYTIDGIQDLHGRARKYQASWSKLKPGDAEKVLSKVQPHIESVLAILKARKVDLGKWDISERWMNWDIPDSFDYALDALK